MTEKHVRTSNGTDRDGHHKSSVISVSSSTASLRNPMNKRERRGGGGGGGKSKSRTSLDTRSLLICLLSVAALLSSFPFALVHLGGGDGEDVGWGYRRGGGAKRDALDSRVVVRSRDDDRKSDVGPSKGVGAVDLTAGNGEPVVRQADGEEPPGGLWSNSTVLPRWMKDYFDWHREKRRRGFDDEDGKTRYLVVQCLAEFGKCGGLADRLKPMAFYVMYANQTGRVLLIRWTRPCRLEDFLVPPANGVDWRVPTHLEGRIPNRSTIRGAKQARWNRRSNSTIMTATLQSPDGGEMMFDEHAPAGYEFSRVFGEMFRCMFELSRPLSDSVRTTMDRLGLVPGQYGTAHVRARYPTHWLKHRSVNDAGTPGEEISAKTIDKDGGVAFEGGVRKTMIDIGINAITCAANLLSSPSSSVAEPEVVVYFASDSHELTTYLLRDAESPFSSPTLQNAMATTTATNTTVGRRTRRGVVRLTALERSDEPLHLDTTTWRNHTPADFYPAFEDLWILGLGRCTSFGMGGYGRFGLALSTNSTCRFNHRNYRGRIQRCERPHWLDESKEKAADAG